LGAVAGIYSLASSIPTLYVAGMTVVGVKRPAATRQRHACTSRFIIAVPAYNEESSIALTCDSLRGIDYPEDKFAVHVIADNCTDNTASIARSRGVVVHERSCPNDPGKGPALNWLRDRLIGTGEQFDALVVVDADTSVNPDFLRVADACLADGASVVQGYYSVRDPASSPSASFRHAALACRHYLRPMARNRVRASCGLFGNGMAFSREVVTAWNWTGHLVEDAELHNRLVLAGTRVAFAHDAVVAAEMPDNLTAAAGQQRRWERGRIMLARDYVPRLARRAVTGPDRIACLDLLLDHLTPPLSVLLAGHVAAGGVGALAAILNGNRVAGWSVIAASAGSIVVVLHAFAGLVAVGAPAQRYADLGRAPHHVVWKTIVWAGLARRGDISWTRTQRNAEIRATG
jgi:hypothetical protein